MSDQNPIHIEDPFIALLPERMNKFPRGPFDTLPKFTISSGKIEQGYNCLAEKIKNDIPKGLRVLVVDGYQGTHWDEFISGLIKELKNKEITSELVNIKTSYASEDEIKNRIEHFLGGNDPLFGVHYPLGWIIYLMRRNYLRFEYSHQ